jgi:putative pyrroloquinoline-quinone binding quinoprotein
MLARKLIPWLLAPTFLVCAAVPASATPGDTIWTKSFGSTTGRDEPADMAIDPAQYRLYVVGTVSDGTSTNIITIAYDLYTGDKIWARRYDGPAHGSDFGVAIVYDPYSRGVTILGASESSAGTGRIDAVTISYWMDGSRQWARRVSNPEADVPVNLVTIDGWTYILVHSIHGRLIAYDPGGIHRWGRNVTDATLGDLVDLEHVGGYLIALGTTHNKAGGSAMITAAFSGDGTSVWQDRFSGPVVHANASEAAAGTNGTIVYVTGSYNDGTSTKITTIAYEPHDGFRFWRRSIAPQASDEIDLRSQIAVSDDGASIVVSAGSHLDGLYTFLTREYHSDGSAAWTARENGPGESGQTSDVGIGAGGIVFVTGNGTNTGGAIGPFTLAYPAGGGSPLFQNAIARTDIQDTALTLLPGQFGDRVFVGSRVSLDARIDSYATF